MALVVAGKTRCPLCGNVLASSDELVAFPAFLGAKHRLSDFSDAAFHRSCFQSHPLAPEVQRIYERYQQVWASRPRGLGLAAIEEWGKQAFREFRE